MKRFLLALTVLGLLGLAPQAPAACRWFGTQVECDLGGSQLMMGTQRLPEPTCARAFGPELLQGCDAMLDDRALAEWPLRLELQNVGADPGLCRKVGNEVYCY
jgi:hypothetical protein